MHTHTQKKEKGGKKRESNKERLRKHKSNCHKSCVTNSRFSVIKSISAGNRMCKEDFGSPHRPASRSLQTHENLMKKHHGEVRGQESAVSLPQNLLSRFSGVKFPAVKKALEILTSLFRSLLPCPRHHRPVSV